MKAEKRNPGDAFTHSDRLEFLLQNSDKYDKTNHIGFLHYLDVLKVKAVLVLLKNRLYKAGRIIATDPLVEREQHWIARLLSEHNQIQFVRFADQSKRLISHSQLKEEKILIRSDLLCVPCSRDVMVW